MKPTEYCDGNMNAKQIIAFLLVEKAYAYYIQCIRTYSKYSVQATRANNNYACKLQDLNDLLY